jgi:hypothetical protein
MELGAGVLAPEQPAVATISRRHARFIYFSR